MKQYRGYYIDNVVFNSKADIDAFIKAQNIKRMQMFNQLMLDAKTAAETIAASFDADKVANYLHDHCGMSWSEIEAVEFA